MNHLPFDWKDEVDDDHVVAHFVGGGWDGKTYAIPYLPEWKVANLPILNFEAPKKANPLRPYDIAVYKKVLRVGKEAIYWLSRIEKADE